MPRGRRAMMDYDEEIAKIDAQITKWKNTIVDLQTRRRELAEKKERQELSALYKVIQKSGRSVQEILDALKESPVSEH